MHDGRIKLGSSMPDIELWLKNIGLEKYAEVFARHDIDLDVAPSLNEQDLEKLELSLGHRRKFLAAAAKLRAGGAQADAPRPEAAGVERRQVTVVFADLVGSTALASQLDPEDMDGLLQEYRKVCAAVVSRYDGHVAQYLGDGIVAFFGFPAAQEHAAERAVRAGFEIAAAVGRLKRPDGEALHSRVGIATGLVAAGTAGVAGSLSQTPASDTADEETDRRSRRSAPACRRARGGSRAREDPEAADRVEHHQREHRVLAAKRVLAVAEDRDRPIVRDGEAGDVAEHERRSPGRTRSCSASGARCSDGSPRCRRDPSPCRRDRRAAGSMYCPWITKSEK